MRGASKVSLSPQCKSGILPCRFDYDNAEFNLFLYELSVIFGSGDFMNCAVYLNSPGLALLAALTVSSLQVGQESRVLMLKQQS